MSEMNEKDALVSPSPAADVARVEAEKLTRRQALRKFGFGAGLAAIMALSADDIARMAAKKLDQYAGDNKTAHKIADEFKNAGVACAGPSQGGCPGCPQGYDTNYLTCDCCGWFCLGRQLGNKDCAASATCGDCCTAQKNACQKDPATCGAQYQACMKKCIL